MKRINFFYKSISGTYKISWKWIDTIFYLFVIIPYGCEAEIILPNKMRYIVKGGKYTYKCSLNKNISNPYSIDTPIIDIMKNNEGKKLIKELLPKIYESIINKKDRTEYDIYNTNINYIFLS